MDRVWPERTGEAIHTSTFLGHPMALAQVRELKEKKLITQARRRGKQLEKLCKRFPIRGTRFVGKGLMAGLAFDEPEGPRVCAVGKDMLRRGYILLPAGEHGNVIALTPALTITEKQLERTLRALQASFAKS